MTSIYTKIDFEMMDVILRFPRKFLFFILKTPFKPLLFHQPSLLSTFQIPFIDFV